MISDRLAWVIAALILCLMAGLMETPMRQESATTDEPVFLGAGYSYWMGHRYDLNCEHPPLMQLWSTLPLLTQRIETPPQVAYYFDRQHPLPEAWTWDSRPAPFAGLFPGGIDFYYYPLAQARSFGDWLVYGGQNDAARVLFSGRRMQVLVTLLTGLVIFGWARSLAGNFAGLLALSAWAFNPVALAIGHLVLTDPGLALFLPLAVWMWSRFLAKPTRGRAMMAGAALAGALLTKFSAILLLPTGVLLWAIAGWQRRRDSFWLKQSAVGALICGVTAWALVCLLYFPMYAPPPEIAPARADALGVPHWWRFFRAVLVPAGYFKGIGIVLAHSQAGHASYLLGEWSPRGWWYYFPAAFFFKTPVALLLLTGLAVALALRDWRAWGILEWSPVVAVAVYFASSMLSHINIGIRHILPVYALLAALIGAWCGRAAGKLRLIAVGLAGALALVAILAHPFYLQYFNELCGGPANGYKYLADSNLDWGQDALRLKRFADQHRLDRIYLDSTYTPIAGKYYKVNVAPVDAAAARQLSNAWLAVSASRLVQPQWRWLREAHTPTATLGNSTFIYQLTRPE
jgi:hypothetical protein